MKYLRKQYVTLSRPLGISLAPEGCGDSVYKKYKKEKNDKNQRISAFICVRKNEISA